MFISKLFYSLTYKLKFSLQVVIQFLHPVYTDYSLRGASRQPLTELRLFTVISEE